MRPLYAQVLFTTIAFTAMVFMSYFFMRIIVHNNLVRNAESVFSFAKVQLESDLQEPKMMLSGFSQTVSSMINRGDSPEAIQNYVYDLVSYMRSGGSKIMSTVDLYVYLECFDEPVFVVSSEPLLDFNPHQRPWYITAVVNPTVIIETAPYHSLLSDDLIITYARTINDDNGYRIGVVGLNVKIRDISTNVVDVALDQGGYGILIAQDFTIIAHGNPDFIGRNAMESDIPFSIFTNDFLIGKDVVEQSLVNWRGEATIAFFRKMDNGWYLGLLAPEVPFYQSLTNMALILVILGAFFAAALIIILVRIDSAKEKSDTENRHKSVFLANMSHEIRTPMNAIIGMTTIGMSTSEVERKDHCFSKIEDASNHLLGVINDILDMSKIEANKFDLSPSAFNFEKMLQRVVNVINFRVDEKKQKFTIHIDRKIPRELIGDDQRLAQVIANLLGNSVKFTPEKGLIHLDSEFMEENDGICTIQISVTDTGIGMTYEQQQRVFSSFEQAESSTTRKYGGTGLGLAISKNIVELMGGKIWMVSKPNEGSTFVFNFKMKRGASSNRGLLSPDINLRNVRILVVDDDQDILDYFKEISREFEVYCDTAISGKDALKLVKETGFYHIYFVDWKMPDMDGIQLTAEFKACHEEVKSVVIMISAADWAIVEKEAVKAGVDKFLSKPLFPSSIADAINEALGIDHGKIEDIKDDIKGIFSGRKILLVEDVEINREIVKALLEPTEINIDCAENGAEAVRIFSDAQDKYDMIFMDVQMPEMDGYEATQRIRALNTLRAKTIPIVAMTANVFREDVERCLKAGMNSHVGKPLDFDEVLKKLRTFLK